MTIAEFTQLLGTRSARASEAFGATPRWLMVGRGRHRAAGPTGGALKRAFDISVAGGALVLILPFILLVGCAIRLQDGGPMFFGHNRIGYGRRPFRCLKLRTMVVDGDAVLQRHFLENPAAKVEWETTRKLKDDPRVTPIGRILRKTSLDELPQLINIVRGDMSIVGPRPVTVQELEYYGASARHYTATRPGLTGLWQVSGRSDVDYGRRVVLDTLYVRRWSILRDLVIMGRTPFAVIAGRGSY